MRKPTGPLVYTIFSSIIIATFIANIIFYLGVWIVIKRTAQQLQVSIKNVDRYKYFALFHKRDQKWSGTVKSCTCFSFSEL